jgi:peptide/nickel transport system permease protein
MSGSLADDSLASAGQLRLTWLRFKQHRLAFVSLFIVILFYLVAIFADFLAINNPHAVDARRGYLPPQAVHFFDSDGMNPHVIGMKGQRDMKTFKQVYVPDPDKRLSITLFARGYEYELFGLIPTDRHLIGLVNPETLDGIYLLGTAATCFPV